MDFGIFLDRYHKHILDHILSSPYSSYMLKESLLWFQKIVKSKWSVTWSRQWLMMFYFMLTQFRGTHFLYPNFQWWQSPLGWQSSCFWHQGNGFFTQIPLFQGFNLGQCSTFLDPLGLVSLKSSIAMQTFWYNFNNLTYFKSLCHGLQRSCPAAFPKHCGIPGSGILGIPLVPLSMVSLKIVITMQCNW